MSERPYIWYLDPLTGRRRRWYPDEYLATMRTQLGSYDVAGGLMRFDPTMLDPEQCRASLPELKAGLEAITRFVSAVEGRANEAAPAVCGECESRFYPSRTDARYCSGKCRMRAHRRHQRVALSDG